MKRVNLVKKRTLKGLPIDTVKSQERYELRWVQWLADWKIIPIDYDEDEMRIVLLGYADFVHTGGFCKGPLRNQETVKVANVDLHLRAAALRLQALGFDDIRYINRSTRSNAQPKYYVELQRLRVEIERHEAPTQSAVPLDQNLFARIYEAAKLVKKNPKKRLALLLICVSFSFMLRSQNLVKTNKGFNKRIRLEDVVLTDQSNTYLLKGKFSSLPLANTRLATLMIKHQKNNTKNEPRTRAGALFLSPLLTLLEDLKNNKAEGSRCLSDFKVGHTWSSITNSYLSDCLRDFAKGEGLELRVGRKISSHSCRASGAALLLQLGYDPAAIMLLGNWKSLNGLRSYLESQSAAFLEEINEKATKAKPSQNMRVQYPSNFNELSSKAVETQKQESSPSVPSPSASLPHPPKFEGANNPPNANLLNSRRRSLEYSSITDSTSSEEEGEQEDNQFEDAEEIERMGEQFSDLSGSEEELESEFEEEEPPPLLDHSKSPPVVPIPISQAHNSPQAADKVLFLPNGTNITRKSSRNVNKNRKIYSEEEELRVYNEINPPLADYHHLMQTKVKFANRIGDSLAVVFINLEGTKTYWHTGVVLGTPSEGNEEIQEGTVDILWNNGARHEVQLLENDYISNKTFQNLKSSKFPKMTTKALWCWISQENP